MVMCASSCVNFNEKSYVKEENNAESGQKESEIISVHLPIIDKSSGRLKNVELASSFVSGTVIPSGEEFSFNECVGPRTEARGFKKAIVFKEYEKEKELGGGVCLVSSAIHAAAKRAGLSVTERHTHQLPVDYASSDEDAAVYYGELDMKFVNSMDDPIRIDVFMGEDELTVTLTKIGRQNMTPVYILNST